MRQQPNMQRPPGLLKGIQIIPERLPLNSKEVNALILPIFDTLTDATFAFEEAQTVIYKSLLYLDSPTWEISLHLLQNEFSDTVTELVRLLKNVAKSFPDSAADMEQIEAFVLSAASNLHTAIYQATGKLDKGEALKALSENRPPRITNSLRKFKEVFNSDNLAPESRISPARKFIGAYCLTIQKRGGHNNSFKQWRAVYKYLESHHNESGEDAKAAWDYIKQWPNPFSKLSDEKLRHSEKEISAMKSDVRKLGINGISADKVPTKRF